MQNYPMSSRLLARSAVRELVQPFTVEKYHSMYEHGLIPEKTELLDGVIIEKMPKNPIQTGMIRKVMNYFHSLLKSEYTVSQECPVTILNSEPEPDISIVDYREDAYSTVHPTWANLVIQVSNFPIFCKGEDNSV